MSLEISQTSEKNTIKEIVREFRAQPNATIQEIFLSVTENTP
jgi:hypothetical protein